MVRVDDSHALLSQPIDRQIDPGSAYYLTRPTEQVMSPQLTTFWQWILDEADLDRLPADGAVESRDQPS